MLHRSRNAWLAGGGALLLVLSMSGLAGAANLVADTTTPTPATFVDVNGNGIADTCETAVTADTIAAAAALTAADLDGDGTISVTEAAQSGWVGGVNCNHGGYVSSVAGTSTDTCDATDQSAGDSQDSQNSQNATENANEGSTDSTNEDAIDQATDASTTTVSTVTTTTTPACSQTTTDTSTTAPTTAVCPVVAPVAPVGGAPVVNTSPNAHGLAVSTVANSTAVGGKNCNHGGAVSEAAHAAKGLNADKTARRAAHFAKHQGKGHKH